MINPKALETHAARDAGNVSACSCRLVAIFNSASARQMEVLRNGIVLYAHFVTNGGLGQHDAFFCPVAISLGFGERIPHFFAPITTLQPRKSCPRPTTTGALIKKKELRLAGM